MSYEEYETPGWITVGFVSLIIGFNYYIFLTRFLMTWIQIQPFWCLLLAIPFQIIIVLLVWSYIKAIVTEAGYVQNSINDNYSQMEIDKLKQHAKKEQQIKKELRKKSKKELKKREIELQTNLNKQNLNGDDELTVDNFDLVQSLAKVSYCFKCNQVKPPRAHHCKECRKCVLRMDHHCPWVANCVGQRNNKYFILFVFYATLGCGIVCVTIGIDYILGHTVRDMLNKRDQLYLTISGSTTLALTLCIGWLWYFQMQGMKYNVTTVESHIDEMYTRNPFKKRNYIDNVIEIFGPNQRSWLLPYDGSNYLQSNSFSYGRFENEYRV